MFQEAAANLTEMRLLLVELLLQAFQELPLESVYLLNIAKDGPKLLLSEHIRPLAALFYVTLRGTTNIQHVQIHELFTKHNTFTSTMACVQHAEGHKLLALLSYVHVNICFLSSCTDKITAYHHGFQDTVNTKSIIQVSHFHPSRAHCRMVLIVT